MSFLNLVSELAAGNIGFILQLIAEHLLWLFAFACAAYFLIGKDKLVRNFIVVVLYVYLSVDLVNYLGWNFGFVPLFVLALGGMVVGTLTDGLKFLGKYSVYMFIIVFAILMVLHNTFGLI